MMDASSNIFNYYTVTQAENEIYVQKKAMKNLFAVGNTVNGKDYCKANAESINKILKQNGYNSRIRNDVPDIQSSFLKFLDTEANCSSLFVDFVFYYSGEGSFSSDGKIYIKDQVNNLFPLDSIVNIFNEKTKQLKSKLSKSYKLLIILDIFNSVTLKLNDKLRVLDNLYENKQFSLETIHKRCAVLCSPMIESYPVNTSNNISNNNNNNNNNNQNNTLLSFTNFLLERLNSINSPGRNIINTSKVLSNHVVDDFIEKTQQQSLDSDIFDLISKKRDADINKVLGSNYLTIYGDILVSDFILIP